MSIKRIERILVLFFFVFFSTCRLGALDPDKPVDRYLLNEWGVEKGLPSDIVTALAQSPDGFLWIGTDKGLLRYDGLIQEPIYFSDQPDGQSPGIDTLLVDNDGGLWIGGDCGLLYLKNNEIQYVSKQAGIAMNGIFSMHQDSAGNLWIAPKNDYLFRLRDGKFTRFDNNHGIPIQAIYSILEDKRGNLWAGNHSGGLLLYRNGKFVKHPLKIKGAERGGFYAVYYIYEDRQGILWIGANIGLLGLADAGTGAEKPVAYITPADGLSNNNVWSILEDENGNLWAGTEKGLNRIKRQLPGKTIIDKFIDDSIIQVLLEDKERNLWIGSIGSGLKQVRDSTFSSYWKEDGLPYWYLSLYSRADGRIMVGSTLGELLRFDKNKSAFLPVLQIGNNIESEIKAIAEDSQGWLWLGTISRGIWQVKNGKSIHYTSANGLLHDGIGIIHHDARDKLWIGYLSGGISCYQKGIFRHFTSHNGLTVGSVYVIHEDKNNNIWVGAASGIFFLPAGDIYSPDIKTYLPGLAVSEIHEDQSGIFWIGTIKEGIKRYEQGQWFSFPQDDGLTGKEIYKILEDGRGNFWMGTQDGIIKIDEDELNAFAAGKLKRFQATVFGLADGMKNTDCRPRSNNSAIKTRDGELWFGTRRGIAVVNSEKIYIDKFPPPVIIKEAIFNYESIPLELSGETFTGIRDILFYFTAPTFVSPARVKIMYKLEGYDLDWRAITPFSPRKAHYKNLPSGRYRFRVRACNSSGVWNNTGASFVFVLKLYFYQTLFFKIVACLVGMSLVVGFYVGLRKYLYHRKLKNKYKHSTLDPEKSEKCLERLEHLASVEKIFRDENLTLNSLAKQLAIAPRYLSQIVNERLNKNFRDYINEYRIKEAMQLLVNPGKSDSTILETALEVGFNSKEVFNRAFKKFTGVTPSRYIKEHRAEAAQKKTRKVPV